MNMFENGVRVNITDPRKPLKSNIAARLEFEGDKHEVELVREELLRRFKKNGVDCKDLKMSGKIEVYFVDVGSRANFRYCIVDMRSKINDPKHILSNKKLLGGYS